jgi:hypothetical protein
MGVLEVDHRPVGKGNQTSYPGELVAASPGFQTRWKDSQEAAAQHHPTLQRKYESAFLAQAKKSKAAYRGQGLTAAAVEPTGDVSPDIPGGIIDGKAFKASVKARTLPTRKRMVNEVGVGLLGKKLYSEQANQELFAVLIEQVAEIQAENAFLAASDAVHSAILEGLTDGLSVSQTADRIGEVMTEWAPWQAERQAQTDLISLANGSSLTAAQVLGDDGPKYKTWLTAGDEKVRPAHKQLSEVTVPIGDPWRYEGAELQYPGDPNGPDGLIINCRCTQIYTDTATPALAHSAEGGIQEDPLAIAAAGNPYHQPKGSRIGGQFAPKQGTSTSQVTAQADDAAEAKQATEEATVLPSANLTNVKTYDTILEKQVFATNKIFTAEQAGVKVAVKPEVMIKTEALRDNITPGMDLEREDAAYRISERIRSIDPEQAPNVPRYQIAVDDTPGGLGKVGISDFVEGDIIGDTRVNAVAYRQGALYDSIIGNTDRNLANAIVAPDNSIHLIDHGLAFPESNEDFIAPRVWGVGDAAETLEPKQVALLDRMWEDQDRISAEDLGALDQASRDSFWDRVNIMREAGGRL